MTSGEIVLAKEVLQKLLLRESNDDVEVWLLDETHQPPLCRSWVRKGSCPWADRCRHSHGLTLAELGLRATRGACMPALLADDPHAVLERTPGHRIAFVSCKKRAAFDFEDPSVSLRYLSGSAEGEPQELSGFWSALPCELAVATLLSAGLGAACRATAACRDWRVSSVAQGVRDRIYEAATGASLHGCSAAELGSVLVTAQLLLAGVQDSRSWLSEAGLQNVAAAKPIALTADCIALFLDDFALFAVLRSGDLRCYRADTGQLLDSVGKKGKHRDTTCALFFNKKAFLLGDQAGGLTLTSRDDLTERQETRKAASAGVDAFSQLDERQVVALHADGCVDILQFTFDLFGARASMSVSMSLQLRTVFAPAIGCIDGETLIATAADSIWCWQDGLKSSLAAGESDLEVNYETPHTSQGSGRGQCHLLVLEPGYCSESCLVTASSTSSQLYWWSFKGQPACVDNSQLNKPGVMFLASSRNLVIAVQRCSVGLWSGRFRSLAMQLSVASIYASVTFDDRFLVLGGRSCLQLSFRCPKQEVEAKPKEVKKAKPPKMFANKSRGGRKNQLRTAGFVS